LNEDFLVRRLKMRHIPTRYHFLFPQMLYVVGNFVLSVAFRRDSGVFAGREGVKKLANVHIQLLLRIRLSYTVQA
jgi:hypothetical protein